jgi:chromosomal replication initiation ATPase DnaA
MYVAHKMIGRGLLFIGYHMGDRHHTTILHGVRAVRALLDGGDAETIAAVGVIKERLRVLRTGRA